MLTASAAAKAASWASRSPARAFEQVTVLERLMPALDLALSHEAIRCAGTCPMFRPLSHLARSIEM
jgi:hypothetical protein